MTRPAFAAVFGVAAALCSPTRRAGPAYVTDDALYTESYPH
jgi:hypothetical protein